MKHLTSGGPLSVANRAARWAGLQLGQSQQDQLTLLATWLVEEAIPAGGLGPSEGPVVYSRHIADSLLFARPWDGAHPPRSLVDVGTGVGLPGLPLAIAWPTTEVILLDRSSRRTDLVRRAVRILDLDNVKVVTVGLREWTARSDLLVCRGVGSPGGLRRDFARLLASPGTAVVGGSHRSRPRIHGYRVWKAPKSIMGYPVWLLSMDST